MEKSFISFFLFLVSLLNLILRKLTKLDNIIVIEKHFPKSNLSNKLVLIEIDVRNDKK